MNDEEIDSKILKITFVPRKNSPKTDFEIEYRDIPKLISILLQYNKKERKD